MQGKGVLTAVSQLHGRELGPAKKGKGAAAKADAAADAAAGGPPRLWARQVAGEGAHHKKWRLILRNLSFQVRAKNSVPSFCTLQIRLLADKDIQCRHSRHTHGSIKRNLQGTWLPAAAYGA